MTTPKEKDQYMTAHAAGRSRGDGAGIKGVFAWELRDKDGNLKAGGKTNNLITAVGDQYYAGRAALSTGLPAQVTGMRLGTGGGTAASKTGAGAAIVTYLSNSNRPFDSGFPTAVAGVVTWKRTYAAGEATSAATAITEAVLNTDTIANDNATTATAANTIARIVISIPSKQATDVLTCTWTHTLLGS